MSPDPESALQFPCRFPIKAMGDARHDLVALVSAVAARHDPEFSPAAITTRASNGGRYVSVTVTVQAISRDQLDTIYRELTSREEILMVL